MKYLITALSFVASFNFLPAAFSEEVAPFTLPEDGVGSSLGLTEERYQELLSFSTKTRDKLIQLQADTKGSPAATDIILKRFSEIYLSDQSYDVLPVKIVIKRSVEIYYLIAKYIPTGYTGRDKILATWLKRSLHIAIDYGRYDLGHIENKLKRGNLEQSTHPFFLFGLEYSLFLESFEQVLLPFARLRYRIGYLATGYLIHDLNDDLSSNSYAEMLTSLDQNFKNLPENCDSASSFSETACTAMLNSLTLFRMEKIAPYVEKYDLILSGKYYLKK
jgi:hypothetical protein